MIHTPLEGHSWGQCTRLWHVWEEVLHYNGRWRHWFKVWALFQRTRVWHTRQQGLMQTARPMHVAHVAYVWVTLSAHVALTRSAAAAYGLSWAACSWLAACMLLMMPSLSTH
jgi:hypothetical protein